MNRKSTLKLVLSALFLALGIVLPLLTGHIPEFGYRLLPMHLPVLLCGFILGWPSGLVVGLLTPILSSLLTGMPPLFPVALTMSFELAAYGFMAGLLYNLLPKKPWSLYVNLILSMIAGRIIWGFVTLALTGITGSVLTWPIFISAVVIDAIPGIIVQIVIIPLIIMALEKAKLMSRVARSS
jgi:riboflavin transporter FmnP